MNDSIVRTFVKAIKAEKKDPSPYDTTAKVTRIEGNTAWVHISGGVDETPVRRTVDAKVGDEVQVRVGGGKAWITGNASSPPTDDTRAIKADANAIMAKDIANSAFNSAETAADAAGRAITSATQAANAAASAQTSANNAQTSANNAAEYASRALGGLSTVQSVAETLTWITQHGTMALTTDVALDPTHVYFVRDNNGDYTVGSYKYSIVTEPDVDDISTYYELTIDESLNNYVGTHLALTNEGLWLLPSTSGTHKVLIATGAGTTYTTAGTYIIDSTGGTVASFRADGATIGENISGKSRAEIAANGMQIYRNVGTNTLVANIGFGSAINEQGAPVNAPYYTFGERELNGSTEYPVGAYSFVAGRGVATKASATSLNDSYALGVDSHSEGSSTVASGEGAHAEGITNHAATSSGGFVTSSGITASGNGAHAEGYSVSSSQGTWNITASGNGAHAEGYASEGYGHITAEGKGSHAQNAGTQALSDFQTAIGRCNVADGNDTYAFIIGNGTGEYNRSNALTVAWNGNVDTAGDINVASGKHFKINGTNLSASDVGALPNTTPIPSNTSDLVNDSGFITNTLPNDGHIYGTLTDDSTNSLLTISASNNCVVGYGGYTNENGDTNVYGNNVHIRSKSDIKMNTVNITSPTLSSSGLSAYSSRVAITKGGVFSLGKWRFVQLDLLVKSSMAANNYWNILTGFDVPVTSYSALSASVRGQNNGLLSAYINSSGNLIVETDDAALSVDWSIEITGWYIAQ